MKDEDPPIDFFDGFGENIEVEKGEAFTISATAFDFGDDNWTSPLLINADLTPRSISVTGSALDFLQIDSSTNIATVSPTATFGNYELIFTAKDYLGRISLPVTRALVITDKSDPVITLNLNPYPWPLGTPWDVNSLLTSGAYSAFDAPAQDLTTMVQISGQVDHQTIGDNNLGLSVTDDFGRTTSTTLTIRVGDQVPPQFSFSTGSKVIEWFLGTPFQLSSGFVTASDNVDGNITGSIVFADLDIIDENVDGNQTISLEVSDAAGNTVADSITVSFQSPSFSLNGVAIDGYLSGASVVFRPTNPSISNNLFFGTTDSQGGFKMDFLASEFALVDTNGNGLIDPEEGMIEVSGGVDSVTSRIFEGTLKADGGAAVVTPLTTVIAEMVNQGTNKENAISLMAEAFGLPASLD